MLSIICSALPYLKGVIIAVEVAYGYSFYGFADCSGEWVSKVFYLLWSESALFGGDIVPATAPFDDAESIFSFSLYSGDESLCSGDWSLILKLV